MCGIHGLDKVWDWFIKFETKKPSVCNVYLDFLDGLTHTSYSVQVLDEWDFNESDRVHAWSAHVRRILIFNKVIDE